MDAMKTPLTHLDAFSGVPGVVDVRQQRSLVARNALIEGGMLALNTKRFDALSVSELTERCGQSVGGFYARFTDKDAFFRALCATTVDNSNVMVEARFSAEYLRSRPLEAGLDELVDLMTDIFTARWRGVLREALLRILDPEDPWEPMRQSARKIVRNLHAGFLDREDCDVSGNDLSFCFQAVVGVLQNDLLNDYHVYKTRDQTLRAGLKVLLKRYVDSGNAVG